jgi:two-component system phosphate regulon sensor histidine kinase PhoR
MEVLFPLSTALAIAFLLLWRREAVRAHQRENVMQSERSQATLRLECELRDQERARRELEEVLASLQDAVLMVDTQIRLRFLNSAALSLFEVRIENVLGAHLLESFPSFDLETSVQAAIHNAQSSSREVSLHAPRPREVLLRVSPVRRGGQVAGAVVIIQDLTELRRLERVRRDFVANASHELRTPVTNIHAMTETLLSSPEDTALAARFHPQIMTEAQRLSRLVNDLLDLAKLEKQSEEKFKALHDTVDLVPLVYEVINQSKYKALERHIAVESDFAENCRRDVLVFGDAVALEQVVFNLLDNALDYTPPAGTVTVSVSVGGVENEQYVVLAISDTGTGIPESDLPRIFERFYRADKVRSRAQGGTGLGLAIAKHIVENHGGRIAVESVVGQGTTFTVTLPMVTQKPIGFKP